jgi:hypothetical protein
MKEQTMSVITIMARALAFELDARGFEVPGHADCEAIIEGISRRAGEIATAAIEARERAARGNEGCQ